MPRANSVQQDLSQLNKYLLSSHHVPSIVIGTRDTMVKKTDMVPGSLAGGRYRQANRR